MLQLAGDPVEIGMEIAIASFDSISEVNMVSSMPVMGTISFLQLNFN